MACSVVQRPVNSNGFSNYTPIQLQTLLDCISVFDITPVENLVVQNKSCFSEVRST